MIKHYARSILSTRVDPEEERKAAIRRLLYANRYRGTKFKVLIALVLTVFSALAAGAVVRKDGTPGAPYRVVASDVPACQGQTWPYYSRDCLDGTNPQSATPKKVRLISPVDTTR